MKKIIALGILAVVSFLNSCSSDDSSSNSSTNSKTIKTFSEKIYYNGEINAQYTSNFNYENGKLVSITSGSNKLELIYNGDKIVRSNSYQNNILTGFNTLSYEGTLLKSILNDDEEEKTEYSYSNGVLSAETSSFFTGSVWQNSFIKNYTFSNNNVQSKITNFIQMGNNPWKSSYDYDSKNNPLKNMNPYLKYLFNTESFDFLSGNNVIKQYTFSNISDLIGELSHEYIITYDSDNYPLTIKKYAVYNGVQSLISEANIQYN
jgi:hypothetical protein